MKRAPFLLIALIVALAIGCGQSQFLPYGTGRTKPSPSPSGAQGGNKPPGEEADEPPGDETDGPPGDEAEAPPDDGGEGGAASDPGTPCQGFAQAVASVDYGAGAGFGQSSFPAVVLGPPRGAGLLMGGTNVLSLGTGGEIVLDLGTCPAIDGEGADFIVFENSFLIGGNPENPFAEPATVGVSEDGVAFVDFPCAPAASPYAGCAGWHPVLSNPQNGIDPFDPEAAGGEAYDLEEIGAEGARYIRIRDAGNGGGGGAAGFDLDAIAVINGMTP